MRQSVNPVQPAQIDPFQGTRHRVFKPRVAKLSHQLTDEELRQRFGSRKYEDLEKRCAELRQQHIAVYHEINSLNSAEEFREKRARGRKRAVRSGQAGKYLEDMYSTVSHVHHDAKHIPDSERDLHPRPNNTDITSWCSNVLNHFWIYESSRVKAVAPKQR